LTVDGSFAHSEIKDESASNTAALEPAVGFGRPLGWHHLGDA